MDTPPVLTPEITVRLSNGTVATVREMRWPQMRLFLGSFAALGNSLGTAMQPPAPGSTLADVGAGVLSRLPDLITSSTELSEQLLNGCVPELANGRILKDDLPASDFLRLLDASLGVTLNEEILRLGKSVAGRVKDVMAPATPSTRASPLNSIPSSPAAGPTATS